MKKIPVYESPVSKPSVKDLYSYVKKYIDENIPAGVITKFEQNKDSISISLEYSSSPQWHSKVNTKDEVKSLTKSIEKQFGKFKSLYRDGLKGLIATLFRKEVPFINVVVTSSIAIKEYVDSKPVIKKYKDPGADETFNVDEYKGKLDTYFIGILITFENLKK